MTDYFALLNQPRRPCLDPEELKQAFHERALRAHPDAQPGKAQGDAAPAFELLNEAHQVLQDPKRRLQHLLGLCGNPPERHATAVPPVIAQRFPVVAGITQRAAELAQQNANATATLARSLLTPRLRTLADELNDALADLRRLQAETTARLQQVDGKWNGRNAEHLAALQQIYIELSYLTRWIAELEERRVQLSAT